jgi:lipopolysaccharide export LptBFGC system permease protein LptF
MLGIILVLIFAILLLVVAFPLKNWLAIKSSRKVKEQLNQWLLEKPTLIEYCQKHNQDIENPQCFFCGAHRQGKILKASHEDELNYGIYNNYSKGHINYLGYHCSRCNTELYRTMSKIK